MSDKGVLKEPDVVQICVKGRLKAINTYNEALFIPLICSPIPNQNIDFSENSTKHLHLQLADMYDNDNKPVDIFVDLHYFYNFITGKTVKGDPNTLVALESNLGFILCGESQINSTKQGASNMTNFVTSHNLKIDCEVINSANGDMTFKEHFNRFWEMESLVTESNSVYETSKNEIYFDGQPCITSLSFKPHHKPITDDFMLSKYCLHSLKNKLGRDPDLKREYHEILQD